MATKLLSFGFDGSLEDAVSGLSATATGPVSFTTGAENEALRLNGTDTWLDFASPQLAGLGGEYTLALWQYGTGGRDQQTVLLEGANAAGTVLRVMFVMILDGDARVSIEHAGEVASEKQAPAFYLNGWNHWAFTVSAATGSMVLYRNGEIVYQRHDAEIAAAPIETLRIGAALDGSLPYPGSIDSLQLFDGVLPLAEIRALVAGGRAGAPSPANAGYLMVEPQGPQPLRWRHSGTAERFAVYLGTGYDAVLAATEESPEFMGYTTQAQYTPEGLGENTPYFWRVDVVNGGNVTRGLPWKVTANRYNGPQYAAWGQEVTNVIERDFRIRGYDGYYEDSNSNAWSFVWPNSINLMAFSTAAKTNPNRFIPVINNYIELMDAYIIEYKGILGYTVSANATVADRFYDDNSWVSISLCDAYEVTGNPEHLRRSILAYDFTLSGETPDQGGGIWWRETYGENDKPEKAMSATAGAIHAAAKLYVVTGEQRYLEDYRRLLKWTLDTLEDEDGLILNSIYTDGSINYVKWAYNTGVPGLACLKIYERTRDEADLAQALKFARASVPYWLDSDKGTIADSSCFGFTLTDLYLRLYEVTGDLYWKGTADACLHYVHYTRDDEGRYNYYPLLWNSDRLPAYEEYGLLYTAPNARAFWSAALLGAPVVEKQPAIDGAAIQTTASSYWPGAVPENTVNGSGLESEATHDNAPDAATMWHTQAGGGAGTNPSPGSYEGPAWIQFTFDRAYALGDMWIWNHNQLGATKRGLQDVYIEVSPDGESWQLLGEFRLNEAAGADRYPYNNEIFFGGVRAKAVLVTAKAENGNFGEPYYGLSAVRFGLVE